MLIDEIRKIFDSKNFLRTNNNIDIDGLNGKLVIHEDASIEEKLKAINLCAIVGFYCTAIDLPIIKIIKDESQINECDIDINEFKYEFLDKSSNRLNVSSNLKMESLSDMNSLSNGLLINTDCSNEFLPDKINAQIIISNDGTNEEFLAACNIATTLGLNSLGCNIPLAFSSEMEISNDKNKIFIGANFKHNFARTRDDISIDENNIIFDEKSNSIIISGGDNEIEAISKFFCENLNYIIKENEITLSDFEVKLKNCLSFKQKSTKEIVFEKEYDLKWEVDEVYDVINKEVVPNLKDNDDVEIDILVSEEKEVREELEKNINNIIEQSNANLTRSRILSSYKQGFSWITEEILPNIKGTLEVENIKNIDIVCKAFLPEGKNEWNDEDGATPNMNASNGDDPNRYLDLPIRLVQELYPVDDLIESSLNISRDLVTFKVEDSCENDYKFVIYDQNDKILFENSLDVSYSERAYLDGFEGIGKVHPCTGKVKVSINGEVKVEKTIKTDVERIWDIYQSEILSECREYIFKKTKGNPTQNLQPFFDILKLEILTSEPDYKLNCRQDIISALSALHEDIYFVGLDYFKTLGLRTLNESLDEPGLILPIIKKRNGQGTTMKVTLEATNVDTIYNLDLETKINKLSIKDNYLDSVYLDIVIDENNHDIVKNNIHELAKMFNSNEYAFNKLVAKLGNEEITVVNKYPYKKPEKNLNITNVDISQDTIIGYDEYIDIINKLKRVDGINVWKASASYQGRDIYAIEVIPKFKSSLISKNKLINNKPVFQINNRHHANEISSTNSAFLLLEQLLNDDKYKHYVDKVNVVMIPFENVDGGYIHYELQKDNPEWQLHVARFNSVGKEFVRDYFKEDSKYTESRALTNLWYKWLPDILCDNHGVPKHEWDQQFSGYTSPWFKGFWLPRALFYGYFWYLDEEKYPENKTLSEALQDKVSDYINSDEEITRWNVDWKNRFEKYAHSWMPKLFPANYYKDLIYYWIKYKADKDSWHVSHRYPWITALDWTTEVSDETAQGEYLELCSRTHNLSDIATIEMMANASFKKKSDIISTEDETVLISKRIRPIEVN